MRVIPPADAVPGPVLPAAAVGEGQRAAPPAVVVAPEIAVRIIAAFTTGGTSIAALGNQWHLTPGEVIRRPQAT